ncbi:MAG: DAK2 domain-containing protein [Firmicutes bacterium]|nr:DAK2 domain-containing protein [Bacillota bacterium]
MTLKITELTAETWSRMMQSGCAALGNNKDAVNALNVFPVPDGDTGINMYLTVNSAVKNIGTTAGKSIGQVADAFAMGALMGARGNSGVILSQMFRGISQSMAGKDQVSPRDLAAALQRGVDLSYKSVMKPVEGTILSVFKAYAAAAGKAAEEDADMTGVLTAAQEEGERMLAQTQFMLPALTEAGVVDAGGKGLLFFLDGCLQALSQKPVEPAPAQEAPAAASKAKAEFTQEQDIEFAYCTQLLIKGSHLPLEKIREHLSQTPPGDSLLVVGDDTVIKIHFHNNHPGQVLEYCSQFGSLHDIIVDNMRDQHHENMIEKEAAAAAAAAPPAEDFAAMSGKCGVIAVCSGEGMGEVFHSLGAKIISGGQTMNPSAEDLLNAINASGAEEIVLLPNNSNIILTANQAQKLTEKTVTVVPSKFVTQGVAAMLAFDPEADAAENRQAMSEAIGEVLSGELTYAVRPAKFNGFEIKEGDVLGLQNGDIVVCGADIEQALLDLLAKMTETSPNASLISLFYGMDVEEAAAEQMKEKIAAAYPLYEVEMNPGGQPLYYYLISLE